MCVRSITSSWKYPVFVDFDTPITPEIYKEIIMELEQVGGHVLISTCDQGGKNEGLAKRLGITKEKFWIQNPFDSSRIVLWSYDFIHVFKNDRNNTLDYEKILPSGKTFGKRVFQELIEKMKIDELSCGYFLNYNHIDCAGQDRQDTKLAYQLFSDRTAALFRRFMPDDEDAMAAADYCDMIHKGLFFHKIHNFKVSFFHKIHIFKVPFFTKFTFSKLHFSQNSPFSNINFLVISG